MSEPAAALTPHESRVLKLLQRATKPLSAYALLEKLARYGVKSPPTVYRALDGLTRHGLVHRIESLNAFVACHEHGIEHVAHFAVCRACGTATEIHDDAIGKLSKKIGATLAFRIEREMLELVGTCRDCSA